MIEIISNDNKLVAEAPSMEAALLALTTCVPEEEEDLRAVDEQGNVLAWGCYVPGRPTLHLIQGVRRRLGGPGVRIIDGKPMYSSRWLNDDAS